MSHLRRKRSKPTLESLENRQLLAGNVTIDTSDGNLVITGDALANRIAIRQTGLGQYTIDGLDGEQFCTPGGSFQKSPVTVSNVRGGLLVSLAAGDDSVSITGTSTSRPVGAFVTVLTGPGKDQVNLNNIQTGGSQYPPKIQIPAELKRQRAAIGESAYWNAMTPGSLTIDTGSSDKSTDSDRVGITSANVQGPTWISTGSGDDRVSLEAFAGRQAVINTTAGADRVDLALDAAVSLYSLNMNLGDQNDFVGIGQAGLSLIGADQSVFQGGKGVNTLAGIENLAPGSASHLADPSTTGFIVLHKKPAK